MKEPATTQELFEVLEDKLALEWVAGRGGGSRSLAGEVRKTKAGRETLVGPLNNIHPNRIQIIGPTEQAYLAGLGKNSYQDTMDKLFLALPAAVILCDIKKADEAFIRFAEHTQTALFRSRLSEDRLLNNLQYYLSRALAEHETAHGVFMEVLGMGVLLSGDPAMGKSELALELITRGHRLIADDAPVFTRIAPDLISGASPPLLQEFLEVRGLGILNIRAMFGGSAIIREKYLSLIINLKQMKSNELAGMDRLQGSYSNRRLLGLDIPEITVPVAPGRSLAILVETAVRQHIHRLQGYNASDDFIARQQKMIEESAAKRNPPL